MAGVRPVSRKKWFQIIATSIIFIYLFSFWMDYEPMKPDTETLNELQSLGKIESQRGTLHGAVIGIPHGTADYGILQVGLDLANNTNMGVVYATGFVGRESDGKSWRFNVNRPTKQYFSGPGVYTQEKTRNAVYLNEQYLRQVESVAGGSVKYFFEIHCNSFRDNVEIASYGLNRQDASTIKQIFYEQRAKHLGLMTKLGIVVEPLEESYFCYTCTTRVYPSKGAIIELLCDTELATYGKIMSDTLKGWLKTQA